ncbi:MAG: O-antigen ligase family protein [Saprospiraceae bacterium]|nr:O-antigen ligase family protein [Saprospiraceae bacterium]
MNSQHNEILWRTDPGEGKLITFIFILLCLLAASLPFENILIILAEIDTPFRPHRILAIIIGFLIFLIIPLRNLIYSSNDLKLAGIYLLGLIPTFVAFLDNRLEFDYFLLTSLQLFIILWIYFMVKSLQLSELRIKHLFHIFCCFTLLNAIYMIYIFVFEDIGRQSGFMDNPNYAAFTLNISLAFYLYKLVLPGSQVQKYFRLYYLLAFCIVLAGIFVTGSRSALVSLILTILLFGIIHFSWKRLFVSLLFIFGVFIWVRQHEIGQKYLDVVPLLNRLEALSGREESRLTLWIQGWRAFEDTYFLGLGIEQFKNPKIYSQYLQTSDNPMLVSQEGLVLHNDYLAVLFEFGILPFLLFISFYFNIFYKLLMQLKQQEGSLWFVCFVNVLVFSFFDTTFQSLPFWFVILLLSALADMKLSRSQFTLDEQSMSISK